MTMLQVDLGSMSFNDGVADGEGTLWYIGSIDGWDSPSIRQNEVQRSSLHGSWLGQSVYGSRSITLRGFAKCTSEDGYYNSKNALAAATELIEADATLKVYESTETKQCSVVRSGPIRISDKPGHFIFEVPLIALDPTKYSATLSTDTAPWGSTVTNDGNYRTYPTVTLVSGFSATTVVLTNTTISGSPYMRLTNMNNGDVIDFKNRLVTDSGGSSKYASVDLSTSIWWFLAAGSNSLTKSGGTNATITWRDAWI